MAETKNKIYSNLNVVEFIDALTGNIDLILPLYQRDASWSEELRKSFLKKIDKNKTFLNSIILVKKCDDSLKFEVVDGQQRLLSLLINDESDLQKPLEIQINSFSLRLIREFDEFLDIDPIQITCVLKTPISIGLFTITCLPESSCFRTSTSTRANFLFLTNSLDEHFRQTRTMKNSNSLKH